MRTRRVVHDDERRGLDRGQRLRNLRRQQESRQALAEVREVAERHAGHETGMLALQQPVIEPAAGDEGGRLWRGPEQGRAQRRRRLLHEEPGERRRGLLRRFRGLAGGLALAGDLEERCGRMQVQQVIGDAPCLGDALRVAGDDRDALELRFGPEIRKRRQHALELRAGRVPGPVPEVVPQSTMAKSSMPASASVRVTLAAARRCTSGL